MHSPHWLRAGVVGLLIGGCAGMPGGMNPETRTAIAPTGQLRVAFITAPIYAVKDSATGAFKGVAIDLGQELARRVELPFVPVAFPNPPALIGAAKSGEWDVALMGINAERAAAMDFSAPFMEVEQGFLVRAGVTIATAADVDRSGIRVGVLEGSGADAHLSGSLKTATLVRIKTLGENYALLDSGKADVIAATKQALFDGAASRPGSRVLEGRFLVEPIGIGVPRGRAAAAAEYVGKFVEDVKARGRVQSAIQDAKLRGVVAAPLK
ncbi:MAG TPA: transporter substrate-binding domain-containing protein [Methylibium sp.]|nr:transporter substrate-binding domain-containing protein [Methylibium sp.]